MDNAFKVGLLKFNVSFFTGRGAQWLSDRRTGMRDQEFQNLPLAYCAPELETIFMKELEFGDFKIIDYMTLK